MFNRIIVATDLSAASFAIANYLGGLRAYGAKQCLLLLCLDLQETASTGLSYTTAPLEASSANKKQYWKKRDSRWRRESSLGSPSGRSIGSPQRKTALLS